MDSQIFGYADYEEGVVIGYTARLLDEQTRQSRPLYPSLAVWGLTVRRNRHLVVTGLEGTKSSRNPEAIST